LEVFFPFGEDGGQMGGYKHFLWICSISSIA